MDFSLQLGSPAHFRSPRPISSGNYVLPMRSFNTAPKLNSPTWTTCLPLCAGPFLDCTRSGPALGNHSRHANECARRERLHCTATTSYNLGCALLLLDANDDRRKMISIARRRRRAAINHAGDGHLRHDKWPKWEQTSGAAAEHEAGARTRLTVNCELGLRRSIIH